MTTSFTLTSWQPHPDPADREAWLTLLGRFHLEIRSRCVVLSPSVQRLLAFLALHREGVARPVVAETLWPDLAVRRAGASLRSTLWRLSRCSGPCELVRLGDATLSLAPRVGVDLHLAERSAARLTAPHGDGDAGGDARAAGPVPRYALDCLGEDLLPDWPEDWLLIAREHFRQTRLHALEAVCRRLLRAGLRTAAMEAAMAAVEAEPLRESAHRHVVRVHMAEGNAAEALRHYEFFRLLLRRELGLAPSAEFRRLMAPCLGRPLDRGPAVP
ncbi:BTAD domain-containing putative transcriptional regulator [Streptomyces sp. TRM 70361]|uniref:AfsR/SARP family transcriptional regulator n=1 Tax=Streptomyces sp. TRM 70361 TaxID=3116553 RepID=UPI002E7AD89F|nr:BTAD domain-containing putative transcriptional regulator [Streptomyces sp. TRM 70361]MEE1941661.1 BTAD domain-containing putative transcriptional regulator [Streptomyces sp. TRM 70361]